MSKARTERGVFSGNQFRDFQFWAKEIRRRLDVISRDPSEDGCFSLVYATCKPYEIGKYGFKSNDLVQALWKRLREQKLEMITQLELDLRDCVIVGMRHSSWNPSGDFPANP